MEMAEDARRRRRKCIGERMSKEAAARTGKI
jgi:hypothetical protein